MRKARSTEEPMGAIIREADREPMSAVPGGMRGASRRSTRGASASADFR